MTVVADIRDGKKNKERSSLDNFQTIVKRLSRQSVEKHFDAYVDIEWDLSENRIDLDDEHWGFWKLDPLNHSSWYHQQSPETQKKLAIARIASIMRIGWEFENLLQRGLLAYAFRLPNGMPEFRYIHHEVIEESHHSMMFQEFVNRTGLPVKGMPPLLKWLAVRVVLPLQFYAPSLFFFFVLGGEDPIDHIQRSQIRSGEGPPIVQKIMKIHVTEEARHLSFARNTLKLKVPELGRTRKFLLGLVVPILMAIMVRLMVYPSRHYCRKNGVPMSAFLEAINSLEAKQLLKDAASKPRKLSFDLGLINPVSTKIWKICGLWDEIKEFED
ncbi:MAG: diiron oxygenase [Acidimicrobiales bacterium]|nr:diiron oxygenase [Acidimicrobiales bacterium]